MQEPLEQYLEAFDRCRGAVEDLLEATVDLTEMNRATVDVLTDTSLLEAVRYLAGPPISADDLKTLAEASLAPSRLRSDPHIVERRSNDSAYVDAAGKKESVVSVQRHGRRRWRSRP